MGKSKYLNAVKAQSFFRQLANIAGAQQWANENVDAYNQIIQYQIDNKWSSASTLIANELISQMTQNPDLSLDVDASFKSPFNIDRKSIDKNTPEGAKFDMVYESLMTSPTFKKLFVDLFGSSARFNVKFEIVENLDKNGKQIDGFATPPDTKNGPTIIQISKQILTTNGIRPKTNIEIAKTILHECIHAYLAIKGKFPDAGGSSIPGIENMTFEEVMKATRPGKDVQHDFMYNHMRPTMQKILGESKDLLTTLATRAVVEKIRLQPNFYTNPQNTTLWNWNDYFYYLSLAGLHNTEGFIKDFPNKTDQYELFMEYLFFGHKNL